MYKKPFTSFILQVKLPQFCFVGRVAALKWLYFIIIFMLLFSSLSAGKDDDIESEIEKREVKVPKVTDQRIQGYRKDYQKVTSDKIQIKGQRKPKPVKSVEPVQPSPPAKVEAVEKKQEAVQIQEEKAVETPGTKESEEEKLAPGYYGSVKNGKREGLGTLVLQNGDVYRGNWRNDRKSGHGIYFFADGTRYNGSWSNDAMNGQGSLLFQDGSSYFGEFKNGTITGLGTFTYRDGAIYSGEWNDGKWHGEGKLILPDGREIEAVFANHKIIRVIGDEPEKECVDEDVVCPVF